MLVLGYEIQSLVIIISITDAEFGITIAAIPFTIILLIFCAWSVRHERVTGMIIAIVCFIGGLAYFLFKVTILESFVLIPARPNVSALTSIQIYTCTTSTYNVWYYASLERVNIQR